MISQPPNQHRVMYVLDRCRELNGDDVATMVAGWLASDWNYAATQCDTEGTVDQSAWCAVQQLLRAARLRADGHLGLANMVDHLAEACVSGWRDELDVRTTAVEDSPCE